VLFRSMNDYYNMLDSVYRNYALALRTGDLTVLDDVEFKNHRSRTYRDICPCPGFVANNEHSSKDNIESTVKCRGLISTKNYKCSICDTAICRDCHVVLKDEHQCKQEDIETIKIIFKESKPCPNCATPISKVDGCDQMYCIACQTAFSWNTGKIESGRIHNPHYYEQLRNRGVVIPREPGDNGCNDEVPVLNKQRNKILFNNCFENSTEYNQTHKNQLIHLYNEYHRNLVHNNWVLNHDLIVVNNVFRYNFNERIAYLMNFHNENDFKKNIYNNFIIRNMKMEVRSEMESFNETIRYSLNYIYTHFTKFEQINLKERDTTQNFYTQFKLDVVLKDIGKMLDGIQSLYDERDERLKMISKIYGRKTRFDIE